MEGLLDVSRGLMFQKPLPSCNAVLLKFNKERACPIHMLFVFFRIDVVWLDAKKTVVGITRNVKPFSLWVDQGVKAKYVLETHAHATKRLRHGDRLVFAN